MYTRRGWALAWPGRTGSDTNTAARHEPLRREACIKAAWQHAWQRIEGRFGGDGEICLAEREFGGPCGSGALGRARTRRPACGASAQIPCTGTRDLLYPLFLILGHALCICTCVSIPPVPITPPY